MIDTLALTIAPRGPFSLRAAARFGFGPYAGRASTGGELMRVAFPVDGGAGYAGVVITQEGDDEPLSLSLSLSGGAEPEAVRSQVARILSLDHDGDEFMAVGERDQVLGRLQHEHPGQRPVLFHSPYEAAAWAIISVRRHSSAATSTRTEISRRWGCSFQLAGEELHAFPSPERLLEVQPLTGLSQERIDRLHGVAQASLAGELEVQRLLGLGPEAALEEVRKLRGIGPFYAGLVVMRATGFADAALSMAEPKVLRHAARLYGREPPLSLEEFGALAERWRPFRTWATVLVRLDGERAGTPEHRVR